MMNLHDDKLLTSVMYVGHNTAIVQSSNSFLARRNSSVESFTASRFISWVVSVGHFHFMD